MATREMRAVLANKLMALMAEDKRICVIDADLAKANGTMKIRDVYPDRAFDVGIAEANMASIAAGMSSYGFVPFIGSFTPFATRRICDQITISIAYTNANVKIIGSDPGITAELNGGTHMSVEDIGVLRSIPNMVIFEPIDGVQLEKSVEQIIAHEGPVYIRLHRKNLDDIFDENSYNFDLFKADVLKEGTDISIIVAGGIMTVEAIEACKQLEAQGYKPELISVHTIKPLDRETILASAKKTGRVVTVDNHNVIGALGSAVAELLSVEHPTKMRMIGINDRFGQVGKMPFLKEEYNMRAEDIVKAAKELL